MGKQHRQRRASAKALLRKVLTKALAKTGNVVSLEEARRILRDPGYKETEYGELRSTIRKLTQYEIVDRLAAKAMAEIHAIEDARIFAEIEAMLNPPPPPPRRTRWDHLRESL